MEQVTNNNNNTITTTTPKLSLYSLPSQHSEPTGSESPPLRRASASVPFLWEEVPGKPRRSSTVITETEGEEVTNKSLGLPPRLVKFTKTPSPTTVLDGPDVGRSFSFRSPENRWRERGIGIGKFGSARWGSFRKGNKSFGGSFDISSAGIDETGNDVVWLSGLSLGGSQSEHHHNNLFKKIRRKGSFLNLSSPNNNKSSHSLLASIYESFKQVVPLPWRRKQEKLRKMEA